MERFTHEIQERIWRAYMSTLVFPCLIHEIVDCDIDHVTDGLCPILGDISAKMLWKDDEDVLGRLAFHLDSSIYNAWLDGVSHVNPAYPTWYPGVVYDELWDVIIDVRGLPIGVVIVLIRGLNRYLRFPDYYPLGDYAKRRVQNVALHRFPDGRPHWVTCQFHPSVTFLSDAKASKVFLCSFSRFQSVNDWKFDVTCGQRCQSYDSKCFSKDWTPPEQRYN